MGVNFWHWNLQNNKKDSEIKLRKWRGIPAFRQAQTSGTRYCKRRDRWAAWSLEQKNAKGTGYQWVASLIMCGLSAPQPEIPKINNFVEYKSRKYEILHNWVEI